MSKFKIGQRIYFTDVGIIKSDIICEVYEKEGTTKYSTENYYFRVEEHFLHASLDELKKKEL